MKSPCALLALVGALVLATACVDDSIELSADTSGAPADGMTLVEVRASVTSLGLAAADGTSVSFRASAPLLFDQPESARPVIAGALLVGRRDLEAVVRGGVASVYVRAPIVAGVIELDARYNNDDGTSIAAHTQIDFSSPPLVSSGTAVVGELAVPQFLLDCDADRVGGFVPDRPDISIRCSLIARSLDDAVLHHTPVRLFAEAGELTETPATETSPRVFHYRVPALLERRPADVRPLDIESEHAVDGSVLIPGSVEQNPRDGLVTLLAVVRGHEAFTDTDGNGRWDEGEPFLDEGEPFLDVDDDGVWDPLIDGPLCCDSNENGLADGPNGVWDGDVWLGRTTHVTWTGPVALGPGRSDFGPDGVAIDAGAEHDLTLTIVDANFNPVTLGGADDRLLAGRVGPIALDPRTRIELPRGPGFPVYNQYPGFRFAGPPRAPDAALEVDGVRRWTLTVEDDRQDAPCQATDWTLFVEIFASPSAQVDMPTVREELSVGGTLSACAPAP